ncbi:hypothetical protein HYV22_02710 [Candidatus Gottesmanbacteria bacterium]|nr:hypothetical protein [Candidatus Gottesmanbacteria bacterium]
MQIHIKGSKGSGDQVRTRGVILQCLHNHDIHYDYWTWDWENPVQVTDDNGKVVTENGIVVELPGTEAILQAVPNGLLEDMSSALGLLSVIVYVVMAPVEASYKGERL